MTSGWHGAPFFRRRYTGPVELVPSEPAIPLKEVGGGGEAVPLTVSVVATIVFVFLGLVGLFIGLHFLLTKIRSFFG